MLSLLILFVVASSLAEPLPAAPVEKVQRWPILLDLNVNGKVWQIEGFTEWKDDSGESMINLDFDRTLFPEGFQPELLSYILFGKVWPSKPFGSALNMFAEHDSLKINVTRTLRLMEDWGKLEANYTWLNWGDKLKQKLWFHVWGTIKVPWKIVSYWPMVEVWQPSQKKCFWEGEMPWMWKIEGNDLHSWLWGWSESDYWLLDCPDDVIMDKKHMRVFTFWMEPTAKGFILRETIKLYVWDEYIKTWTW